MSSDGTPKFGDVSADQARLVNQFCDEQLPDDPTILAATDQAAAEIRARLARSNLELLTERDYFVLCVAAIDILTGMRRSVEQGTPAKVAEESLLMQIAALRPESLKQK